MLQSVFNRLKMQDFMIISFCAAMKRLLLSRGKSSMRILSCQFHSNETLTSNYKLTPQQIILLFLTPLVFLAHLFLLGRREIVLDVERFPDLLRCLAFNHVGHRLARYVQQAFNVQIVCR